MSISVVRTYEHIFLVAHFFVDAGNNNHENKNIKNNKNNQNKRNDKKK